MAIIEIKSLVKEFKTLKAIDSISLEVKSGEIFGLLGPNGAGKTTTVKILTTLLPPTSGEAFVDGFNVVHEASKVRRVIGYVPQALSADGTLTGYENLLIFAKLYDIPAKIRKERIFDVLDFMGLTDHANKLVRNYSGGMIRRLEVAQAMLHHPMVLFLDEPTVGLDPVARQIVWEHIMKLRKELNMTIFMTTHYMEEADSFCDRIAIMNLGKVAAIGTVQELKTSIDKANATLDDVFAYYSGSTLDLGGSYRDSARARNIAKRLG
ncbi:ATP-binding cassette domain-containing protein [Athalassotoga sp.]|uniref:ATP-binding cassette domain-containing protein n=2 Tax=Athalassotoga sp. TaxID=2022597 RepID=UPI003CFBE12B